MWGKGEALKHLNSYFHHFELQNIFFDFDQVHFSAFTWLVFFTFIYLFFHHILSSMKLNNLNDLNESSPHSTK